MILPKRPMPFMNWIFPVMLRFCMKTQRSVSPVTVNDKSLIDDLNKAKKILNLVKERSIEFSSLIKNLKYSFEVVQDDKGKGIFRIAKLIDGKLVKC